MENEEKEVGAVATTEETGADKATETKRSFDELLQDKEYQSAFDKKIAQSLQTAKAKWEEESKTKMAEAEKLAKMDEDEKAKYKMEQYEREIAEYKAKENARTLKDEAINIISQKEIPVAYLDLFKFENMSAEEVKTAIETIEALRNKDRESYLNNALKQKTPTQKQTTSVEDKDPYLQGFDSI
ncbi:MAG: DUF4355 domain-containing protein [Clostridia bacterium]|jgi:hypothetical protein|nr:DUF4355 domain-containing protein [Clostridia bacterium]